MSDPIKDKIRKLLALAGNNPSEEEADVAMRMALKMMAKHNLDMADFAEDKTSTIETEMVGKGRPWERQLCIAVADLYFCSYFYRKTSKTRTTHVFVGSEENVAVAQEITHWLIKGIASEARRGGTTPYFNSFCTGASLRISERAREIVRQAKAGQLTEESTGKALVLASVYDRAKSINNDYLAAKYPDMKKKALTHRTSSGHGYDAGRRYGDSARIQRAVK